MAASVNDPHVVTLLGLCNDLLRRRRTVVAIVAVCALGSALVRLAQPRTYTAVASFVPDAVQPVRGRDEIAPALAMLRGGEPRRGESRRGSLGDVGAFSVATPPALPPSVPPVKPLDPEFYWLSLRTRELLLAVSGEQFTVMTPTGVRTGTAADFYGLPPDPTPRRSEDAARRLARELEVSFKERTGVLTLSVRAFDPNFARALAERLLDALRQQHRRMADARSEAQVAFLTRATTDALRDLTIAQGELARFLSANRAFGVSSRLALEFRRRDADVLEKRGVHADLAIRLERAKLDRSRAGPIISVVQRPETPAKPDPRGVLSATIVGTAGGIALALLIVLIGEHLARLRAAGYRELSALEAEWSAVRRRYGARLGRLGELGVVAPTAGKDG